LPASGSLLRAQTPTCLAHVPPLRAPLLWLLLPLAAGFALGRAWPVPAWVTGLALPLLGIAVHAVTRDRPRLWMASLCGALVLEGVALLQLQYPYLHEWSSRPPREITVVVEVRQLFASAPTSRQWSGLATITSAAENDPSLRNRRVAFSVPRRSSPPPFRSGTYRMQGVLEPLSRQTLGQAGFDDYLVNAGVRHRLSRGRILAEIAPPGRLGVFYQACENRLETILSAGLSEQPQVRSLYLAMLLGEKAVLSPDQENAFIRSGTFHIFSISGLHVAVIALALHRLFRSLRLPAGASAALIIGTLWLYVQITGGSTPAVRAFLMIVFLLGRRVLRLPGNPISALVAAALATVVIDPLQWFSPGFQMSYTVVAALILLGDPLGKRWLARWKPFAYLPEINWRWWHRRIFAWGQNLLATFALGWSAFLASIPTGIGYFGLLSPGSLLANLAIIPLSSAVIYAGFLSLLCGLLGVPWLSALLNRLAALVILTMDRLLQAGTALPGNYFEAHFRTAWLAPVSQLLLLALLLYGAAGNWHRRRGGFWLLLLVLGLVVAGGVAFDG